MDPSIAFSGVNYLAVVVAAGAVYVLRILWYSPPLFEKQWVTAAGLGDEMVRPGSPGSIFGASFVLELLASFALALFIGPEATFHVGLQTGVVVGGLLVGTALGVVYLFERRPLKLWLLNAGYMTCAFAVMGGILGAWRG